MQGGGVHGAFGWGVLDRLLETGMTFDRVCGVSSGALTATMLVQGMVKGGPAGARAELRRLWEGLGTPAVMGGWEVPGWDLGANLVWQGMEAALRMFSPSQLNPFGHNPMRGTIAGLLDRAALADPTAMALTVAATEVSSGAAVFWGNREIDVDVLLASSCLPFVFHAVEIGGRAFWDGGYSGNPPLAPLLRPSPPDQLVLIRAQPRVRPGVPQTPAEILNRVNEIACNTMLHAELDALPASVRVVEHDADAALAELPLSSKYNADGAALQRLFAAGRAAVG